MGDFRKPKHSLNTLLKRLFNTAILYTLMKVSLGLSMLYISKEQLMHGVYPSENAYKIMSLFTDLNNVLKLIVTPLLFLYAVKILCDVLYIFHEALNTNTQLNTQKKS